VSVGICSVCVCRHLFCCG